MLKTSIILGFAVFVLFDRNGCCGCWLHLKSISREKVFDIHKYVKLKKNHLENGLLHKMDFKINT